MTPKAVIVRADTVLEDSTGKRIRVRTILANGAIRCVRPGGDVLYVTPEQIGTEWKTVDESASRV